MNTHKTNILKIILEDRKRAKEKMNALGATTFFHKHSNLYVTYTVDSSRSKLALGKTTEQSQVKWYELNFINQTAN